MKIALITDQHFGARNDAQIIHDHFETFYSKLFFPYLKSNNITRVVGLGDVFDRRKYINYYSLKRCKDYFFDPLLENNIQHDMIVGNHDTYYKNSNFVNSPSLLLKNDEIKLPHDYACQPIGNYTNITVHSGPTDIEIDGTSIAIIPWICSGNYQETMRFLIETKSQVAFGHLEIAGFQMYRGSVSEHGMSKDIFKKFDQVFSGHFHHKSSDGNIHYLGSPYEMTWSDYDDPRGFHVYDTSTRELTYIQNPYTLFEKIHYDDTDRSLDDINSINYEMYKDKYIKVIVHNKTNPYWFDIFIDKLEKVGIQDLQVIDDNLNLDLQDDQEILSEIDDTETLLKKYVEQIADDNGSINKKALSRLLVDLYTSAQNVE